MLSGKSRRRRLKHLYYFSRSWSWVSNTHVTDVACKVRVKPARAAVEREENCCCCHNYGFETGLFMWFLLTEIKKTSKQTQHPTFFLFQDSLLTKKSSGADFQWRQWPKLFSSPFWQLYNRHHEASDCDRSSHLSHRAPGCVSECVCVCGWHPPTLSDTLWVSQSDKHTIVSRGDAPPNPAPYRPGLRSPPTPHSHFLLCMYITHVTHVNTFACHLRKYYFHTLLDNNMYSHTTLWTPI